MTRVVPAFFMLALFLAPSSFAVPPEEFPDPNENPKAAELTAGERLIRDTAKAMKNDADYPGTPEAVEFALFLFAESGETFWLDRAETLARQIPSDAGLSQESSLLKVSHAKGVPLENVELQSAETNTWAESLAALRAGLLGAARSGSSQDRIQILKLARQTIDSYWDAESLRFQAGDGQDARATLEAARLLWELGYVAGEPELKDLGKRALAAHLPTAAKDPNLAPAAALAAARIERYPVQMVLIGDPQDPTLTRLREVCASMFEPRRVLIHLDPAQDADRIEELMYPAELAPVLFVCVESICSAPITEPAKVEGVVASILAASKDLEE